MDASLLQSSFTFNRVQVATMTVLVYDWLLLFGEEVDLVWRSRWTLPKALFLLSRYTPFADLSVNLVHSLSVPILNIEACSVTYTFISFSMTLGMALSEIVMILRVQAMYDRSKMLLFILGGLWVVLTAAALVFTQIQTHAMKFVQTQAFPMSGCSAVYSATEHLALLAAFASLLLMETILVLLTLRNAYKRWTSRYYFVSLDLTFQTLYFDGILFFVYLLLFSYLNIVFPLIEDDKELQAIFITPMRALHGLFSCRMLLNIRRVASRRVILPISTGPPSATIPRTPVPHARHWATVHKQLRAVVKTKNKDVGYGKEFDWVNRPLPETNLRP